MLRCSLIDIEYILPFLTAMSMPVSWVFGRVYELNVDDMRNQM
jgi:hypothetical protein